MITSPDVVMLLPRFICWFVCLSVCLSAGLLGDVFECVDLGI